MWDTERAAGDIAAALPVSAATVSEHLSVLRRAGLVDVTQVGTSRRYRARQDALAGLHGALEAGTKWLPAADVPERDLISTTVRPTVTGEVEVNLSQEETYACFTKAEPFSAWLGVPVTRTGDRFATTLEWGTEIRGKFEVMVPPRLLVISWNFDDDNIPVPGPPLTTYLHITPTAAGGTRVEVHQIADIAAHTPFLQGAWQMVFGRFAAHQAAGAPSDSARSPRVKGARRVRS